MNEQELNLSKLSYVNKDFRSIYPDLLDLVKTLTNRWDPSSSNESDPGVVLLKIGAFLADHLNYNIDKNILEAFLPSATQEESVRKIAEFGGYTPRYYRSAVGKVSVAYNPETWSGGFNIPPFTLVITNDDGSITYTQLDSIPISEKNVPWAQRKFIEGTIQRLMVDSPIITMTNIDDFRRVYFPNQYVAENGIFIYNVDKNGKRIIDEGYNWTRTSYIYTQPVGTRCYKIDFDSSKLLPYIEFPTDIANLIGDGLAIFYIYTSGSYGNVRAGELTKIVSLNSDNMSGSPAAKEAASDIDHFIISNPGSIINGQEPESINEIYNSYKKVVGTFDTLVSTQDYSNAIRILEDDYGERIVSNGLITDRRIDYNQAINVLSTKIDGTYFTNVALNFGSLVFKGALTTAPTDPEKGWVYTNTIDNKTYICTDRTIPTWEEVESISTTELEDYMGGMTSYDLIIYALQKYSELDYNSVYYWKALENSFKQIDGDAVKGNVSDGVEDNLIDRLDTYKCINHNFTDLENGQVYCFKNYTPLNVDIVPYNKVSKYERNEIINNIRKAISDNFNASKVEFGEELNYDIVKKVIEEADSRINYVRLSDFDYHTKAMLKNSGDPLNAREIELTDSYDGSTLLVDLAAKNVIAGRLCLFNFDDNFNYRYGQIDGSVFEDFDSLISLLTINSEGGSEGAWEYDYTLNDNEFVEIYYPNYYSDKTYGSYVLYNFVRGTTDRPAVPAGSEYRLAIDEHIDLWYKDSNGNNITEQIKSGTTIRASFDLLGFNDDNGRRTYQKDSGQYKQISSNESISTRVLLDTKFNSPMYVYWILNNNSNTLFTNNDEDLDRTLGSGEYFIYTDSNKETLTIFGRGTHLHRDSNNGEWSIPLDLSTYVSPNQFNEDGLANKIPFISFNFTNVNLTMTEMNIVTLGKGDRFSLKSDANSLTCKEVSVFNVSYVINDGTLVRLPSQVQGFYTARTRLDIKSSPDYPMALISTDKSSQSIIVDGTAIDKKYFQTNLPLDLIGSTMSVNGTVESVDLTTYKNLDLKLNLYAYNLIEGIEYRYSLEGTNIIRIPFSIIWDANTGRKYITQLFLNNLDNEAGNVTISFSKDSEGASIVQLGHYGNIGESTVANTGLCLNNSSVYVYPVPETGVQTYYLNVVHDNMPNTTLIVTDPKVIWGPNDDLGDSEGNVVDRITELLTNSSRNDIQFHWTSVPKQDLALNKSNMLDPYSLFDHNNVANIITIPEIDLRNSNIEIVNSMRNY